MYKFHIKLHKETNIAIPYHTLILESQEHFLELRDRILQYLSLSLFTIILFLCSINIEAEFILRLIPEIQFFQLSPQDFLIASFLAIMNIALLITYPYLIKILIFFFGPSLLLHEKKIIYPLSGISIFAFFLAIYFTFNLFAPLTFEFFLQYNNKNIEPFWSFNDFSTFLIKLIYITIILFQLPLMQIISQALNIISTNKMIQQWKLVIAFAFLVSGIITPSTDPITQSFLAIVICALYGSGILLSNLLNQ